MPIEAQHMISSSNYEQEEHIAKRKHNKTYISLQDVVAHFGAALFIFFIFDRTMENFSHLLLFHRLTRLVEHRSCWLVIIDFGSFDFWRSIDWSFRGFFFSDEIYHKNPWRILRKIFNSSQSICFLATQALSPWTFVLWSFDHYAKM